MRACAVQRRRAISWSLNVLLIALITPVTHSFSRHSTFFHDEFALQGVTPDFTPISFRVGLPLANWEAVQSELTIRSQSRNWMSASAVRALTATEPHVRARVASHLTANNASCTDSHSGLFCVAPAASCNVIFNTRLHAFVHYNMDGTDSGITVHRVPVDAPFTLPAVDGLLFVTGIVDFPTRRRRLTSKSNFIDIKALSGARRLSGNDRYVVPETLWSLYGTARGSNASSTAAVEFGPYQSLIASDVFTFATNLAVPQWSIAYSRGPFANSVAGDEAALDGEYLASVGLHNAQYWWSHGANEWMYEFTQAVLAPGATLPNVFSISWGSPETSMSSQYVQQCEQGLASIALLGITVVASSGDAGAAGNQANGAPPSVCSVSTPLVPLYPASSQYVLSVGATQLAAPTALVNSNSSACVGGIPCAAGLGGEMVCSVSTGATITSGGGFSTYLAQPSWQSAVVNTYLSSGVLLPPSAMYNAQGRAYPDVAAMGHNLVIVVNGTFAAVDGTSASAPIWAAIIGLANSARFATGLSPLGFVNPTLYSIATSTPFAFTDITVGNNTCATVCGCRGFGARIGWDAVTGLGSPSFAALLPALISAGSTSTATLSATASKSGTATPSLVSTAPSSATTTSSATATTTASSSCTRSGTTTSSSTDTVTTSSTQTISTTISSTATSTETKSSVATPSSTSTTTSTQSWSRTATVTSTPATVTPTVSATSTHSVTSSSSSTPSQTSSSTSSATLTPPRSPSSSMTKSHTGSISVTSSTSNTGSTSITQTTSPSTSGTTTSSASYSRTMLASSSLSLTPQSTPAPTASASQSPVLVGAGAPSTSSLAVEVGAGVGAGVAVVAIVAIVIAGARCRRRENSSSANTSTGGDGARSTPVVPVVVVVGTQTALAPQPQPSRSRRPPNAATVPPAAAPPQPQPQPAPSLTSPRSVAAAAHGTSAFQLNVGIVHVDSTDSLQENPTAYWDNPIRQQQQRQSSRAVFGPTDASPQGLHRARRARGKQ